MRSVIWLQKLPSRTRDRMSSTNRRFRRSSRGTGGKYLTRAGTSHPLEGDLGIARMVIVEFESLDTARRFYESAEYAPLLKMRKENTQSHVALVEGYAAA